MLRTMDVEILGLSPTAFWLIIAAAAVLVLVILTVLLVCCCCYCYCKNTRKNKVSPHDDFESTTQLTSSPHDNFESTTQLTSPPHDDFESTTQLTSPPHDDFELTIQLTSQRSDADLASYQDDVEKGGSVMWPGYMAKVDSIEHEIPVVNINQKRAILPLPRNFFKFIIETIVPFFKEQRLVANQFAVVILLSEKNFYNICSTTFVPSDGGRPLLDNYYASMPQNATQYGNYIAARPTSKSWHSEEEIFGNHNSPFSQLWNAYVKYNGSPPKCILLYSWNLPCSRCTDVIIRSLNVSMYRCTSVIVAHTTYWQGELGGQCIRNEEKFTKENITVKQVRYPEYIPPA